MVIQERLYTADDLWELSHNGDGIRYELIEGVLYEMPPAGGLHGDVASEWNMRIRQWVKQHDLGFVTAAETGFSLSADGKNVLAPDVGFIAKGRIDALPDGFIPLAPDLAVEVVSPNDSASYIQEKVSRYLQYGVKQVWVVYPKQRQVVIHTPDGAHTRQADDTLYGGDILPGFALKVGDIFA